MVGSKVSPTVPASQLVLAGLLAGSSVSARTWEGGDHHSHLSSQQTLSERNSGDLSEG